MNQHSPRDRDQIRDQDAKGHGRTGRERWDDAAVPSATNGVGGGTSDRLGTGQRYNRRSTARKLSLRAVVVFGGGVGRDQIRDQDRLMCLAGSQVGGSVSRRMSLIGT